MLASLAGFFAQSALMSSPVGGVLAGAWALLKRVPGWVWLSLAVVLLLIGGYRYVKHEIHAAYVQGSKDGHAAQLAYDQAQAAKVRAAAIAWKTKADAANTIVHQKEQALHDQTVANNRSLANALRVRIRAQVPPAGGGGSHLPGAAAVAGQRDGPQPPANASVDLGADPDRVCVPAGQLVDYAEQADNDHDALIRIEDAWKQYQLHWPKSK